MERRSFTPLFLTNFFGVINDNYLKTLAMFLVTAWLPAGPQRYTCIGIMAGALVLPYILFSPLANRLMQHHSKLSIFLVAKWAELPIMGLAIAGLAFQSIWVLAFAVFCMGLQSSLYSPAKYALVRDVGGPDRISIGIGGMDGLAFLAMLSGTVFASYLVDHAKPVVYYVFLLLFAVCGLVTCLTIRADEEREEKSYPVNPFTFLWQVFRQAGTYRDLNRIIMLAGVFWWTAAIMQMGLVTYGKEVLKIPSFQTGIILAIAAVGITAGNITAGFVDRRFPLLKWVPVTGVAAALLLLVLFLLPPHRVLFSIFLGLFSFEVGFFKLPLDAQIQRLVKGPALNTILSYFNQVTFIFILIASGCYSIVSSCCGPRAFLFLGALFMGLAAIFIRIRPADADDRQ